MTKDYQIYQANKGNISDLVYQMYTQYKGLIDRSAKRYSFHSGGRIEKEDFISNTYERLYYFAKFIKEDKINPETFMFHLYVKNAMSSVLKKSKKVNTKELLLIDAEGAENLYQAPDTTESIYTLNKPSFYAALSTRQKFILSKVQGGAIYNDIQKDLNCSYGIIPIEIRKMRKIAKDFF